jgi:hypothetical protein
MRYLQSVLYAAARLTYHLGCTTTLLTLWSPSTGCAALVDYKLAVQSYGGLHDAALNYSNVLRRIADLVSQQHLRSSASE